MGNRKECLEGCDDCKGGFIHGQHVQTVFYPKDSEMFEITSRDHIGTAEEISDKLNKIISDLSDGKKLVAYGKCQSHLQNHYFKLNDSDFIYDLVPLWYDAGEKRVFNKAFQSYAERVRNGDLIELGK